VKIGERFVEVKFTGADVATGIPFACVASGKLSAWTGVLSPLTKNASKKPTSKTANGGRIKPDKQPLPCAEAAVCQFGV
jgi:hypothetical protein